MPFQPIIETYLHLAEIEINPANKRLRHTKYLLPETIVSKKVTSPIKRTYTSKYKGLTTKLPRVHFVGALLLRNEILGCMQKAMDKEGLLRNFRKEFPDSSASVSRRYAQKFPGYRNAYNKGKLYVNQPVPPLFSFVWNKEGYIRHNSIPSQLLSFRFCKRVLTKNKFADPRFFTEAALASLRDDASWFVPALAEIQRIEAEIGKPLYDSIEFPPGYGKEYDPL